MLNLSVSFSPVQSPLSVPLCFDFIILSHCIQKGTTH